MAMENEFRYWQSYQSARMAISLGGILRQIALVLLLLGSFVCLVFITSNGNAFGLLLWAIGLAANIFIFGVVVGVLGRMLQMTTDIAVNGSLSLTNEEKAKIIERSGSI